MANLPTDQLHLLNVQRAAHLSRPFFFEIDATGAPGHQMQNGGRLPCRRLVYVSGVSALAMPCLLLQCRRLYIGDVTPFGVRAFNKARDVGWPAGLDVFGQV